MSRCDLAPVHVVGEQLHPRLRVGGVRAGPLDACTILGMPDTAMTRLQSELHRLYLPPGPAADIEALPTPDDPAMIDAHGQVRALVLALSGPADWALLSTVWHGVQAELELPAPAIAVAGAEGYQLWFSLAEPVPVPRGQALLEALRRQYLGNIKASRVGLLPALTPASTWPAVHARPVPAPLADGGHWSAFVTPDLAPVFADEPWLDSAPNPVGQADLLSRLKSIPAADVQRVLDQLQPAPMATASDAASGPDPDPHPEPAAIAAGSLAAPPPDAPTPGGVGRDPKRFLLDVMNDPSVPLGLRIDAAKALLPYLDHAACP
jgi:hypothetical protein